MWLKSTTKQTERKEDQRKRNEEEHNERWKHGEATI